MAIENKLLKIERDAQKAVRLSNLAAQTLVDLDLNYTDLIIRNNKGDAVSTYVNASREDRSNANKAASALDIAKPDDAPHTIEAKSAITFKEDGTLDFGDASFGDLFPTAEIEAMIYDIEYYTDCENIKQMIKDQLKVLTDQLKSKAPEIANLSEINGLMSIPSNPLKILSWARKVVSKFFGPYTLAMIDLALQLALFAGALARLANAATTAQQNLQLCAQSIKEDLVDDVLGEVNTKIAELTKDVDNVLSKISDAQTKIGNITGKPVRFLPESLAGGISGYAENLTSEARADILARGKSANAVPFNQRTAQQQADVAAADRLRTQDVQTRTALIAELDAHLAKAFPTGSKEAFVADIDEVVNTDFDNDPKAQADLNAFANTAGTALQGNSAFGTTLLSSAGAFTGNTAVPGDSSSGTNGEFEIITGKGSFDQVRYTVRNGIIANVVVGL